MSMDVIGQNPTSETGECFRNNIWWWMPLADYAVQVGGEIAAQCKGWRFNDGDGLNDAGAKELARLLQVEPDSGRTAEYAMEYLAAREALPLETCRLCSGSGVCSDVIAVEYEQTTKLIIGEGHPRKGQIGWCNGCNGVGKTPNFATMYAFSIENVQEFVAFLRDSGGFEIC